MLSDKTIQFEPRSNFLAARRMCFCKARTNSVLKVPTGIAARLHPWPIGKGLERIATKVR